MAYTKTEWKDGTTPIDAANMNKIEDGIAANADDISSLNDDLANIDIFGAGTAIQSGDNLDDYMTVGKYYSQNATISGSLTNAPFTAAGFTLYVLAQVSSATNRFQVAVRSSATLSTLIYYRMAISGSFGSWYSIAGSAVNTTALKNEEPENDEI